MKKHVVLVIAYFVGAILFSLQINGGVAAQNETQKDQQELPLYPIDYSSTDRESNLKPIERKPPKYPRVASFNGAEGWVLIAYTVDLAGSVIEPKVLEAYPEELFDKSAIEAVSQWKYETPSKNDDYSFPYNAQVVIKYRLEGTSGVYPDVGRKLVVARDLIMKGKDYKGGQAILDDLVNKANNRWLNLYEIAAIEHTIALSMYAQKEYKSAIVHAEKTLNLDEVLDVENVYAVHRMLASAYLMTNDYKNSVRVFDRLTELNPSEKDTRLGEIINSIRPSLER